MSLNPPMPGLRPVLYDARSAAKVQIIVQPGDRLHVSDDVAEQLLAASAQFKTVADPVADPDGPVVKSKPRKRAAATAG